MTSMAGLSTRLNLFAIGLILLTAAGITGYLVLSESRESDRRLVAQGETIAAVLAQSSEYGIYTEDNTALGGVLRVIDADPDVAYAAVRDPSGRVLLHRSRDPRIALPDWPVRGRGLKPGKSGHREQLDAATGRTFIDLVAPVTSPVAGETAGVYLSGSNTRRIIGYVQVGLDRAGANARLRRFIRSATGVTAGLVVVGIGLTLLVTRRLSAPIRSLAAFTQSVSDDRLDRRAIPEGPEEIRRLAAAFNEMLDRLKASRDQVAEQAEALERLRQLQKMEAVGQLAGGIAHDFNNLMTVVLGQCDLLRNKPGAEPFRPGIAEIARAGERAASLTSQLLAFGRRQLLMPKVLDLNAVIENMQELLHRLAGDAIVFRANPGSGLWPVFADPGQIEQVVVNLVLNARDAMPEGGTISLGTRNVAPDDPFFARSAHMAECRGQVLLCVTDTGTGMDECTRARIFEPFFTTKEVGKGTGLGLSSVYGVVTQSGGCIDVRSAIGEGTTINIYLPKTDRQVEPAAPEPMRGDPPPGRGTVLLVEDGDMVRSLVRELLESYGYSVLEASNGIEALQHASGHEGEIDLMLTDVVMPGMSGQKLRGAIRELRPGLRVLFMSAHPKDSVLQPGVDAGIEDFVQKPFQPETIGWKVHEILNRPSA
jgi:signal transduction histidine kinase/CheY-like chemotaxis protein